MFTGIISDIGEIVKASMGGDLELEIACRYPLESIKQGDSIACNGACLTVVECGVWSVECGDKPATSHQPLTTAFKVQLSAETVARTAPDMWQVGKKLNLERALKLGDTLDGHLVTGHVDGVASIISIEKSGDSHIISVQPPAELAKFIAGKGSVALDGVSLTVNHVEGAVFYLNVIPHTFSHTTLGERKIGDRLNIEIDIFARYIARMLEK